MTEIKSRLEGLDLMRSLAILLVIYAHGLFLIYPHINQFFANVSFLFSGYFGVEIFFVLSGYLIGKIFIESMLANAEDYSWSSLVRFWLRRWLRTLPNYYLVLFVLIGVNALQGIYLSGTGVVQYLTFSQNLYTPNSTFFAHAWSLSVEEWFYFLFPLLASLIFFGVPRWKKWVVPIAIASIVLVCNVLRFLAYRNGMTWDEMRLMTPFRLDSIIYGVLIAYLFFLYRERLEGVRRLLLLAGLTLLSIICIVIIKFILIANPSPLAGLFILAITPISLSLFIPYFKNLHWPSHNIFGKTIRFISLTSYSTYLNHFAILLLIGMQFDLSNLIVGLAVFVLCLGTIFLLSYFQYTYWEKPVLNWRDKSFPGR